MLEPRIKIPEDIAGYLVAENCDDFNIDRFYMTECMEEIMQSIVDNVTVTEEMQKLGMNYMNSTILYGLPGTGKTNLARWIAYYLDMDFVYINFAQLIGGIFGDTSRCLQKIFRFMLDKEAVFMLDELDCIAIKRNVESEATGGELSRITIALMQEFDYYRSHKAKNIILAATNRIDIIDPALLSRFSLQKELKKFTNKEKEEYIIQFLENVGQNGIPYDIDNIRDYCAKTSIITIRSIEADIQRCAVQWIKNGKQNYVLDHI